MKTTFAIETSRELSSFSFYKDALYAFESVLSKGLLRFNSDLVGEILTPEVRMYKCLTVDFVVDFEGYFRLTTKEECLKYLALSFIDFLKTLKYPGKLKKFEKEKLLQAVKDIFIENSIISENDAI